MGAATGALAHPADASNAIESTGNGVRAARVR
jgi:hypothetical protein